MEGAEEKQGDPPSLKRRKLLPCKRLHTLTNVNMVIWEKRGEIWGISSEETADIVISENHEVIQVRRKPKVPTETKEEIPQEVQEVEEQLMMVEEIDKQLTEVQEQLTMNKKLILLNAIKQEIEAIQQLANRKQQLRLNLVKQEIKPEPVSDTVEKDEMTDEQLLQSLCDSLRAEPESEPAASSLSVGATADNSASSSTGPDADVDRNADAPRRLLGRRLQNPPALRRPPQPSSSTRRAIFLCADPQCNNRAGRSDYADCMWCEIHCRGTPSSAAVCSVHYDFPFRCTEPSLWCLNKTSAMYPGCIESKCARHCKSSACLWHRG